MPHRLDGLIAPRSVAIVGASERSHYATLAVRAADAIGFEGALHLVNRRGGTAFGRRCATSCGEIGAPVDAAYLCVPADAVIDAAAEAIAAGIRNLVVLTSGFGEAPGAGVARERALARLCAEAGVRVLGPNCLGFRNMVARVAIGSIPFEPQEAPPGIAIVSASGSVAHQVARYGIAQGTGFTHVVATGNEMNVAAADVVDYLVGVEEVRAIALFVEAVRDADAFARAAEKARAAGKPIVALKVGRAPAAAAVAAAHTGAIVGDDRVFDAACDRHAVVRVPTIEALADTAAALAATGPIARPGVAFVSISGGACGIAADLGEAAGVAFPRFAEGTRAALAAALPASGAAHNPLDVTGLAVGDGDVWRRVAAIVARDPAIGLLLLNWDAPAVAEPALEATVAAIGDALAACPIPALLVGNYATPINGHGRAFMTRHGLRCVLPGIGAGVAAAARIAWWSERRVRARPEPRPAAVAGGGRPADERSALLHLAAHGVAVVPQAAAADAAAAVAAARAIGGPVAVKISSPDIAHKTEAGGVALGVTGDGAVAAAFARVTAAARRHAPAAKIDGVTVSPMRGAGLELLVGVARDPIWGPVLAVGLGGVWVEALSDTALRLLPATRDDIVHALRSLRAAPLLAGFRDAEPVDLEALAAVIVRIGEAALALGPDLAAFEVNPLLVRADAIEALDALAVWSPAVADRGTGA